MKASDKDLIGIYRKRTDWTFRTFAEAVTKATGQRCTSHTAFKLLQKYRVQGIIAEKAKASAGQVRADWMEKLTTSVRRAGDQVKRKRVIRA